MSEIVHFDNDDEVAAALRSQDRGMLSRDLWRGARVYLWRSAGRRQAQFLAQLERADGDALNAQAHTPEALLEWVRDQVDRIAPAGWTDLSLSGPVTWEISSSNPSDQALVVLLRYIQHLVAVLKKSPLDFAASIDPFPGGALEGLADPAVSALFQEAKALLEHALRAASNEDWNFILGVLESLLERIRATRGIPPQIGTLGHHDSILLVADLSDVPADLLLRLMGDLDALHRAMGGAGLHIRSVETGTVAGEAVFV